MLTVFARKLLSLDIEERIINCSAIMASISVFLPWASGYMLGSDYISYSGFGFYTSFIGIAVFTIGLYMALITLVPLFRGTNIVKKQNREKIRLFCGIQIVVLVLSALSVLMRVTFQFSRIEIRFGIFTALISGIAAAFYSFLKFQEQRKTYVEEIFHQVSDPVILSTEIKKAEVSVPAPPAPEEHHLVY